MTNKQKMFCLEYASCGNATQSAIKAGYSKKTARSIGQRLLTDVDIQKELERLHEEYKSQKIMDISEMQETLTALIRNEATEEVIVTEGCGDGVSEAVTKEKTASFKDKVSAIQLLARMQGVLDSSSTVNILLPKFGGEESLED